MNNDIILSICIPTYNRSAVVAELVKSILSCENSSFEVVVLDNCSTDDTQRVLSDIKDIRLRYIRNIENIGGIKNPPKSLTYAIGKYCLLCLDKDRIEPYDLTVFINYLRKNENIEFGRCELNIIKELNKSVIYSDRMDCFKHFAYKSIHPSGMFYLTEAYNSSKALRNILESNEIFGFNMEIINAEISHYKTGCVYSKPLIFTENEEISASKKSFTYSKDNIFFLPKNRIKEYTAYIGHLKTYKFGIKQYIIMLGFLFYRGLLSVTLTYNKLRKDKFHCAHYGIRLRNVRSIELMYFAFKFSVYFVKAAI
jgi:glycosyltransferase involved in cell wall biosynthesis